MKSQIFWLVLWRFQVGFGKNSSRIGCDATVEMSRSRRVCGIIGLDYCTDAAVSLRSAKYWGDCRKSFPLPRVLHAAVFEVEKNKRRC
jgi:hypothetical protein